MSGLHPSFHARRDPGKIAYKMMPSGEAVTYRELDERSNRCAHLLRSLGLQRGDVIAILMENNPRYFEIAVAADRAGLYYTGISSRLTAPETAYILQDSGAKVLFTSAYMLKVAKEALASVPGCLGYSVDGAGEGFADYVAARDAEPSTPIADQSNGAAMLYSSGTTGRPKGVKFPLDEEEIGYRDGLTNLASVRFEVDADSVYLMPAPMYHAAALRWAICIMKLGGTVIAMERFDPELALRLIQDEKVTVSQWVPTHFVRMLKLPEEVRRSYDVSSQKMVFHAAAPCPVPVKQDMIAWWGPIVHEYYGATEFNGMTTVTPEEWLAHPGTVGRATFGIAHIMSDDGETELPPRAEGMIYFEGGTVFSYHNDPEKSASAYNSRGWSALGDVGWMDEEGYLYLTDRKSFMIISGGVNIYPQEIEDAIIVHPKVADAAVIGAPDEDLGERLVAVVQPLDWADAGPELAADIQRSLQGVLGKLKIPKQIDFMAELPRHPTGKLYKRLLRDKYREEAEQAGQALPA